MQVLAASTQSDLNSVLKIQGHFSRILKSQVHQREPQNHKNGPKLIRSAAKAAWVSRASVREASAGRRGINLHLRSNTVLNHS